MKETQSLPTQNPLEHSILGQVATLKAQRSTARNFHECIGGVNGAVERVGRPGPDTHALDTLITPKVVGATGPMSPLVEDIASRMWREVSAGLQRHISRVLGWLRC